MRIYLDHNATAPPREEALAAAAAAWRDAWGNASSVHAEGAAARAVVERAREQVAACLGAAADEVVFTSGASEANNAALGALAWRAPAVPRRLVTSAAEHPSVLEPAARLEAAGVPVVRLGVDAAGLLDPAALEAALAEGPALVSLLWANNETGAVQPLAALAERARARGAVVHTDATQALGRLPVDWQALPVDLLSCSAHKLGGPRGVGALVVRRGLDWPAGLLGGPQERRRRGGTENAPALAGFGAACEALRREGPARAERMAQLCDRLWEGVRAKVPRVRRSGPEEREARLPNTLHLEIEGAPGELLVQALDLEGVAASSGAACASGSLSPSHVLRAMGRSEAEAACALRLSLGPGVDEEQVDRAVAVLGECAARVRAAAGAP